MIGRVINNYEIKSVLAEGGMGKVYLAEHPFMGRRAAIKILRGMYLEDKNMVTRFVNEARAANAIHHPNIVEIIDVGYLPDGPPYLMMEFLEGETLQQRLTREGRLSPADAVHIVDQAASALEAAHAAGIVHRDLKPDNLFLVPDATTPGAERVKVVDFGIAKLSGPGMGESLNTTGVVLGTPNYMSPEQCRGTNVDHRTDIYALGAILYQALCGKPPFVGDAQLDVMMMHVVKIPVAPRDLHADIPAYLEDIALRALAKSPDDRFASMAELRVALGRQTSSTPPPVAFPPSASAPTPTPMLASQAFQRASSRRWLWVSLAIVGGIGVGWAASSRLRGGAGETSMGKPVPSALTPMPTATSRAGVRSTPPNAEPTAAPPSVPSDQPPAAATSPPATTPETAVGRYQTGRARPSSMAPVHSKRKTHREASASPGQPATHGAPTGAKDRHATSDPDGKNWMNKW